MRILFGSKIKKCSSIFNSMGGCKELLAQWNREVFASPSHVRQLPPDIVAKQYLGQPGATEQQILKLEERLGTQLPNSYRDFLKFTNGWWLASGAVYRLWPTDQIEWFRVRHQHDWIDSWTKSPEPIEDDNYFVYGQHQDPSTVRPEYLPSALEISDVFDGGLFLLNPKVTTPEGEWEAWFMATWMAGAVRYPSFLELMKGRYESFISLKSK